MTQLADDPVAGRLARGAGLGALAGSVGGLLGEACTQLVRLTLPTDAWIVGFAMVWGVGLGALVGTLGGWGGWLGSRTRQLLLLAAAPGMVAGLVQSVLQWMAR